MKAKFGTPFILALHLIHAMLYSILSNLSASYLYSMYYGGEAVYLAFALYFATFTKLWIHRQFVYAHIGFIISRGIIYILSFSYGLNLSHLVMLLLLIFISLIITICFFIPAFKKGYFNE